MWSKSLRHAAFGVTFAIFLSPGSVLVLCFGLTGSSGNSLVTGALLSITTLAVGSLCFRRDLVFQRADCLFLALLLCIVSSFAINGWTSNAKEYQLLTLSLAAYPACRFISHANVVLGRSSFTWATSIIVLLGTIATTTALFQQWDDPHGKPVVFGFDIAATHFLGLLSFLIIAIVTAGELTVRRTALISSQIFLPTAIFAASMVRFTFIALAGSLCLAIILAGTKQRRHVAGVALVVLIAMATGLIVRSSSNAARIYANYGIKELTGEVELAKRESSGDAKLAELKTTGEVELAMRESSVDAKLAELKTTGEVELAKRESTHDVELVRLPSCYRAMNLDDSIAIRKVILQDALVLIPGAGWIGSGLDSFMNLSCIKQTEVHNSILQAAVEFGWFGALLLFLLIVLVGSSILVAARHDGASRFVLCSLAFIVLMSLAHGRISRDAVLFAFLGCAVGLKETSQRLPTFKTIKTVVGFVSVYYVVKLAVWGACAVLVYFATSWLYHALDLTSFR